MCMFQFSGYLEPVGAKALTISSASPSFTFKHRIGDNFGLLCQAQAFPAQLIRYFYFFETELSLFNYLCDSINQLLVQKKQDISRNPKNSRPTKTHNISLPYIFCYSYYSLQQPKLQHFHYKSFSLRRNVWENFGLLCHCQAQAYPVPRIRCVRNDYNASFYVKNTLIFDLSGLEIRVKHTNKVS